MKKPINNQQNIAQVQSKIFSLQTFTKHPNQTNIFHIHHHLPKDNRQNIT